MVTPTKGARLGSSPAHERLILANLACSLFEHGRIKTTQVRAKRMQPFAERLITIAKKQTLASHRHLVALIHNKTVAHILVTELAQRFENRDGGYTRIIKTERRKGDQAQMCIIELVEALETTSKKPANNSADKTKAEKSKAAVKKPSEKDNTDSANTKENDATDKDLTEATDEAKTESVDETQNSADQDKKEDEVKSDNDSSK